MAVLNFASPAERFSDYAIEELTGELVNGRKVTIVDRQNLALIASEMNLQMSGDVSDESAQTIGRLLGAESIISGTLAEMGMYYRFRVRVISVETAAIQTQVALDIRNDEQVAFLLTGDAQNAASDPAPVETKEAVGTAPAETKSASARKNWISGGIGLFLVSLNDNVFSGVDVKYERMLGSRTSLGLRVKLGPIFTTENNAGGTTAARFAVETAFRWYPSGDIFFMGLGIGYNLIDGDLAIETDNSRPYEKEIVEGYTTHGAEATFEFGWKWDPGKAGGFFMELYPCISVATGKNPITEKTENGITGGLFFGLGGAF